MLSIEEAKLQLNKLKGKSKFEKMVQTTAILTGLFANENLRPIIVGGLAVEIYTRSEYTTSDIDLIFSQRDIADKYLRELGFVPEGRHWYHEHLLVSVEIPNDMLEDADHDRVIELRLEDDLHVYVIGIEDIILDRLRACVHWKSTSDCEWGKRLFLMHTERLDVDYLKTTTQIDNTFSQFNEWLRELDKES
jgi:predicted nucleotidyltransferase